MWNFYGVCLLPTVLEIENKGSDIKIAYYTVSSLVVAIDRSTDVNIIVNSACICLLKTRIH